MDFFLSRVQYEPSILLRKVDPVRHLMWSLVLSGGGPHDLPLAGGLAAQGGGAAGHVVGLGLTLVCFNPRKPGIFLYRTGHLCGLVPSEHRLRWGL